jgi:hypothetical protein
MQTNTNPGPKRLKRLLTVGFEFDTETIVYLYYTVFSTLVRNCFRVDPVFRSSGSAFSSSTFLEPLTYLRTYKYNLKNKYDAKPGSSVVDPDSVGSLDPDLQSGSRSRRAKLTN